MSEAVSSHRPAGRAPDVLGLLRHGFESAVRALIRPQQAEYPLEALGPGPGRPFTLGGASAKYTRTDAVVLNCRGQRLECSHWEPVHRPRDAAGAALGELDCVVYLHGNSSCRAAAMEILPLVLGLGATVFAFDSMGCGRSEGQWVTLGHWESVDLLLVLGLLRSRRQAGNPLQGTPGRSTGRIALYGRSMGAATAILAAGRDAAAGSRLGLAAVVADSPFSDLRALINDLLSASLLRLGWWRYLIPPCLTAAFIACVRSSVRRRTGMDLDNLRPRDAALEARHLPLLLAAGANDHFVHARNAQQVLDSWGCASKALHVLQDCDHNTRRPASWYSAVQGFLGQALRLHPQPSSSGSGGGLAAKAGGAAAGAAATAPPPLPPPPSPLPPLPLTSGAAAVSSARSALGSPPGAAAAATAAAPSRHARLQLLEPRPGVHGGHGVPTAIASPPPAPLALASCPSPAASPASGDSQSPTAFRLSVSASPGAQPGAHPASGFSSKCEEDHQVHGTEVVEAAEGEREAGNAGLAGARPQ